ncbi:hypothetical protein PI95_027225 [Hassallia byssoidea VB512170]|uniref:Uncharacterized protein n=1 Tax=Hassallia byssoidea VB512170 TaxID=1304833 RepID=A0A846HH20_9CYAN|nr:hypothetical protein [Hassalia byssoidea]NEU76119.1 hypothetical protein [Hassalia byssoidea VB512170]
MFVTTGYSKWRGNHDTLLKAGNPRTKVAPLRPWRLPLGEDRAASPDKDATRTPPRWLPMSDCTKLYGLS